MQHIPVITVDGPSGSGKGTLSRQIANALGWHFLDSGALYRLVALAAIQSAIPLDQPAMLAKTAANLEVFFGHHNQVLLAGQEVSLALRTEECAGAASQVAALPAVRQALLERQRAFLQAPGLVADGRDMGTVIFPQADLKIFLEASAQERARRRQAQLKEQGIDVSLDDLFAEISARDVRDRERAVAPLVPAQDAIILDTTSMGITEVFEAVMEKARQKNLVSK